MIGLSFLCYYTNCSKLVYPNPQPPIHLEQKKSKGKNFSGERKLFLTNSQRICFYYNEEGLKNFCQTEKKEVFPYRAKEKLFQKRWKLRVNEI